jgi:branched-chain amino acid transport system permease protein
MGWSLPLVIQTFVNGLELGLIYALVAVGFSLIYGTARVIFFTHGEVHMVGAMATYFFVTQHGVPYLVALAIIMPAMGAFGLLLDRVLFRRFYGRDLTLFLVSLGLALILTNVLLLIFGGQSRGVSSPFVGVISFLGMTFSINKFIVALISIGLILALHFFFQKVKAGQSVRAYAQNPEAAALMGISINRTVPLTFFVSLAVAAGAGVLVAPVYFCDVFMGTPAILNTFIVVILGGIGSFPGAIVGGLFLGVLHSFGSIFIGELSFLVSFIIIIIFLIVRPQGFFGHD